MDLTFCKGKGIFTYLIILSGCLWLYGCDVLQGDDDPDDPQVEVTGKEIYVIADGAGYIDLYSMVKTGGTVRLDIISQPRNGNLSEVGKGLLQYTPANNFKKGRDSFRFLIYSQSNTVLKEDSVVIIIENAATSFPCGIYPQNDSVYNVAGPVTFDVLRNDVLCGDSTEAGVEIYKPNQNFPPFAGTATITEGSKIAYTPGNNFNGYDSIFYKVFNLADPTKSGIAKIAIAPAPACKFDLFSDSFAFDTDTLRGDTLWLNIFQNDQLCERPVSSYQFELLDDGSTGTASYNNTGSLTYLLPDPITQSFSDSVIYQMCYGQRCEAAIIRIEIHH